MDAVEPASPLKGPSPAQALSVAAITKPAHTVIVRLIGEVNRGPLRERKIKHMPRITFHHAGDVNSPHRVSCTFGHIRLKSESTRLIIGPMTPQTS